MKKIPIPRKFSTFLLFLPCLLFGAGRLSAQALTYTPNFVHSDDSITVTFNDLQGNAGTANIDSLYLYGGAVISGPSGTTWGYTLPVFNAPDPNTQMQYLGNRLHRIKFHIRNFFGVPSGTPIYRLALLVRNKNGTKTGRPTGGGSFYIPVVQPGGLALKITNPAGALYTDSGTSFLVKAVVSSQASISITFNRTVLAARTDTALSYTFLNAQPASGYLVFTASDGSNQLTDSVYLLVKPKVHKLPLPPGLHSGPNYLTDTSVVLVLHAPLKKTAFAVGDFSNWMLNTKYWMNRTPDGKKFWVQINGLTPGKEYGYQYFVDSTLTVADVYCEKILDPNNDGGISAATYPEPKTYPSGKTTGIVSVFQTARPAYAWKHPNFTAPDRRDLVIYEVMLRDYLAPSNYKALTDTLGYLQKLGINAVQLMPVMEFEGNYSWGYNVNFHGVLDKSYGTRTALKTFIDSCHARGIAVILDIVFNHAYGSSPLCQMYWDAPNRRPAANSPFFNAIPTHPYNVGNDFNHRSPDTREYVDYVCAYWIKEFKIDGYRFDLSKGFTQTNSGSDVNLWGQYDSTRVNNLKRIDRVVKAQNPNFYTILEHFAVDNENAALGNAGMMPWGNCNTAYNQCTMGFLANSDLNTTLYTAHGFSQPNLVAYMESHDEERLMYKNIAFGASQGAYNVRDTATALQRMKAAFAFFLMVPGPKMMYDFGELGDDYSVSRCVNGTLDAANCKTDQKPKVWSYLSKPDRVALFNAVAALIDLKKKEPALHTTNFGTNSGTTVWAKRLRLNSAGGNVMVLANFGLTATTTAAAAFGTTGMFYEFFTGDSLNVTNANMNLSMQPGQVLLYTSTKYARPRNLLGTEPELSPAASAFSVFPNPSSGGAAFRFNSPGGKAEISLYNLTGQCVNTFILTAQAGENSLAFNNTDSQGQALPAGIYVARLRNGNLQNTLKLVLQP